jgi:hypothetical protein
MKYKGVSYVSALLNIILHLSKVYRVNGNVFYHTTWIKRIKQIVFKMGERQNTLNAKDNTQNWILQFLRITCDTHAFNYQGAPGSKICIIWL